jgi:hypothetical protein
MVVAMAVLMTAAVVEHSRCVPIGDLEKASLSGYRAQFSTCPFGHICWPLFFPRTLTLVVAVVVVVVVVVVVDLSSCVSIFEVEKISAASGCRAHLLSHPLQHNHHLRHQLCWSSEMSWVSPWECPGHARRPVSLS